MKKIGILYHPLKETAPGLASRLEEFCKAKGLSVWTSSAWDTDEAKSQVKGTDLLLSIGGDGTILRAAQLVAPAPIPITGINLGNLGFMTELSVEEAEVKLAEILAGKGWIDERSLLEAVLSFEEPDKPPQLFYALNDVVVARGAVARVIYVETTVNGELLTTYKADGVIVATATGSTGYSLAAGGPVMPPRAKEILLLPITPHLSSAYTLVLPSESVIDLRLSITHPATLSVDGHINLPLPSGAKVTVKHNASITRFMRIHPEKSFYSHLEQRLKGKR